MVEGIRSPLDGIRSPFGPRRGPLFLLDQLSVPAAGAYSFRKLRSGHTGGVTRIRRSLDNAELDIGTATAPQTRTNLAAVPINNNWGGTASGIAMTAAGSGTEFGQPFVDVQWAGTCTANGTLQFVHSAPGAFNSAIHAPVVADVTYTASLGARLIAGAVPAAPWKIGAGIRDVAGGALALPELAASTPTAALQRYAISFVPGAGAAYCQPNFFCPVVAGEVADFTMRFYAANVEPGLGNIRPLLLRNTLEVVAGIGNLDAEAVMNFVCGAGPLTATHNGFITTRYDQSGNDLDAVQATALRQPLLVSGGAMVTENGRPVTRNIAGTGLEVPGFAVLGGTYSLAAVARNNGAAGQIFSSRGATGINPLLDFTSSTNARFLVRDDSLANNINRFGTVVAGSLNVLVATRNVNSGTFSLNGNITSAVSTPGAIGAMTTTTFGIGSSFAPTFVGSLIGTIGDALVFQSALSSQDRRRIETDLGNYYGISVV